jgi:hypothetical protein
VSNRDGLLPYLQAKIEAQMYSTESPPLNEVLPELDFDSGQAPSNRGHRQKPSRPYRSTDRKLQSRSDKPPMSRRVARSAALLLFAVLVGVGGTLACQSYRDEITQVFPPLGWLSPVSMIKAPAPAVTTADLQEQLKPVAIDLALVRRSIEQLTSNLDQLARRQDQMAQNIATLQAAEQDISQKMSAPPSPPPAPKPVHVSPKPAQPPAQ